MTNRLIAYVFAINQAYEYIRNIVALKKYDLHIKGGRIQGSEKSHPQLGKYEENAYTYTILNTYMYILCIFVTVLKRA